MTAFDTNWMSYTGQDPDMSTFVNPTNPEDYDDIMKFSNCSDVLVSDTVILPGRENCVDAVRGDNYIFRGCVLHGLSGVAAATIKGAINGWTFRDCEIGRGKETDVEVGQFDNYWFPGRTPTTGGTIENCRSLAGGKIRVTCWDADEPEVVESNVEVTKVPWFVWFPYFMSRYLWLKCTRK